MPYSYLQEYKLSESVFARLGVEKVMKFCHHFYTPHKIDLSKAYNNLDPFPVELKLFYETIGFGFMHRKDGVVNRILDPVSLFMINLLQDDFHYNAEVRNVVEMYDIDKQLLFFQTQSGKYIVLDRYDTEGKNAVYFQKEKLANSLSEFINTCHNNISWLDNRAQCKTPVELLSFMRKV
jgi:hypothetical protein